MLNENDKKALEEKAGEYLAIGYSHSEIICIFTGLMELGVEPVTNMPVHPFENISEEDAIELIRNIYDHWKHIDKALQLDQQDIINWHAKQRMELLRASKQDTSSTGVRSSLAVLESLGSMDRIHETGGNDSLSPVEVVFKVPAGTKVDIKEDPSKPNSDEEVDNEQSND